MVAGTKAGQVAGGAIARALPGAFKTKAAVDIAKAAGAGVVVDALAFRPDEGRLTDMYAQLVIDTPLENTVIPWLLTDEDDSYMMGRFKNALEGIPLGLAVDLGIVEVLRGPVAGLKTRRIAGKLQANERKINEVGARYSQSDDPAVKTEALREARELAEQRPVLEEQLEAAKLNEKEVRERWTYAEQKPSEDFHRAVANDYKPVETEDVIVEESVPDPRLREQTEVTLDEAERAAKAEITTAREANVEEAKEVAEAYDEVTELDDAIESNRSVLIEAQKQRRRVIAAEEKNVNDKEASEATRQAMAVELKTRRLALEEQIDAARATIADQSLRRQGAISRTLPAVPIEPDTAAEVSCLLYTSPSPRDS